MPMIIKHIRVFRAIIVMISSIVFLDLPINTMGQTAVNYNSLIKLKKGYQIYTYQKPRKGFTNSFFILPPGLPAVIDNGGIFAAGFNSWIIPPANSAYPIMSADIRKESKDTSLFVLKADVKHKKMLIQCSRGLMNNDTVHSLFQIPYGLYSLRSFQNKKIALWGINDKGFQIWLSDYQSITPLLQSQQVINDVDFLDSNTVIASIDSSVIKLGIHSSPKTLLKLDLPIEAIAVDRTNDGSLYVSTSSGILHFFSFEADDYDIVTMAIHGKLQIYQNKLFVLWREKNQVVEIKLK